MAFAPEDVVNSALQEIGYPRMVGDLYEGSIAARVALAIYGETRDELLTAGEWPFALREVQLTTAGVPAPIPWQNEYLYPSDCLRMRYIRPGPLTTGVRDNDPQPVLFRPWNDTRFSPPIRAILCDLGTPILIYQGRVTDPATWSSGFLRALIASLAQRLAFGLFKSAEVQRARVQIGQADIQEGMTSDDMAQPNDVPVSVSPGQGGR